MQTNQYHRAKRLLNWLKTILCEDHQMFRCQRATSGMGASLCVSVLCICLTAVLGGCATFGECGLHECPADARISAEVRSRLAQSAALGAPNLITVQTVRGVVYMRGLVSTPYQIAEVASVAGTVPGVIEVQNLLTIDNSH